ncbi:Endonuclease/exonuclease/phosphatase [Cokeromyces recurvatus]|uniref:Endonuclease/exonuclease/phosphatase n=1 Tax=Cokeromyces recurvatus TaxID=90255 RepID=UPI00221F51BD|nr:Endonuclease/exonuclease/phosphatase [Cokeromyces recurvatus]KAI7900348.1 Endonuclease/exonuclease/phosphatase [Cokeromyces recurvatus]
MNNKNEEETLSVLSLNCWGLNIVAKKRRFRLIAIADYMCQQQYDIVALQEVWMWEDFDYIKEKVKHKLPFTKYFYSGTLGSGLVLLSRFQILSSSYIHFTLSGRPLQIFQGDFYVGKGCGCICINHPNVGFIDVYTTHLQAEYGNNNAYEAQRITQCWQIANSVRASVAQGKHVILTGDFNSVPSSYCYTILKNHGFMTDSWLEIHKDEMANSLKRLENNELTDSECIQLFGITCDSPLNTWTKHFLKQQAHVKEMGDRLDYIFYRHTPKISCIESRVALEGYITHTEMSYSDHFAVHSLFKIKGDVAVTDDDAALVLLANPCFTKLLPETLQTMLILLEKDLIKAKRTANTILNFFLLSVFIILGLFITQIIIIYYHQTLFMNAIYSLLLILFSIIATVCLVVGFVFGKMEQRSLRQYITDMEVCLKNQEDHTLTSKL